MATITHHLPDAMIAAYATGNLPHPFALVVAAHISLCPDCRASSGAHEAAGGAVMEAMGAVDLSPGVKSRIMGGLDSPGAAEPHFPRDGIFPGPVMAAMNGRGPRWRALGFGARHAILSRNQQGAARLIHIPPGQAVPGHSHGGLELTLVLQGSFGDETGWFGAGDVEVATPDLAHSPKADGGQPCICLAATDAPLRFRGLVPRLLQPLLRI